MKQSEKSFKAGVSRAARDPQLEAKFRLVAQRHGALRKFRIGELGNFEELRERLNRVKETVLSDHEGFIARLRQQVESLGGKVYRAADAAEARKIIIGISIQAQAKIIVKSKSMTSEEVELTPALQAMGIEVLETDLGEYIVQLAGEHPSHIVMPAIHKTKQEIAELFAEKLGMELTDNPQKLTLKAREVLRQKFLCADLGITGANALVAESGTVVLVENEGNIRLTTTLPRVHVALVGIEKIVPTLDDLMLLLKLLPRSATGQKMSGYVSLIRGPRRRDERDGASEFHLVLLDNGRSRLREDPRLREALKCIRCGACLNACPVYQHIGGHAYGSVYPGPIGAMITRALAGPDHAWLLPFLSSLCGACTEVCPAQIPIHHILLELRQRATEGAEARGKLAEAAVFRAWSEFWSRPQGYRLSTWAASLMGRVAGQEGVLYQLPGPGEGWTQARDLPAPADKTFHKRWRDHVPAAPVIPPSRKSLVAKPEPPQAKPAEPARDQKISSPVKTPRPGDPQKLANEMKFMQSQVHTAQGKAEAQARIKEILSEFAGRTLVAWDHPELLALGLQELAREAGVTTAPAAADRDSLIGQAAEAALGVTAVDFALADSGTLVLLTRPGQERSISLLPPVHLAVLRAEQVLKDVEDLVPALAEKAGSDFRGLTCISGPSLTGDIEMVPVLGVHGPGRLIVLLWSEG